MKKLSSRKGLLLLAAVLALIAATVGQGHTAAAATVQSQVFGFGSFTDAGGEVDAEVEAWVNPDGSNPNGYVSFTRTWSDDVVRTLDGDVSQGCVLFAGKVALVVGKIPADQEWTVPGFGTIEYAALVIEDNGSSGDMVLAVGLRQSSKETACANGPSHFTQPKNALDSGNFTVVVVAPSECEAFSGVPQNGLTNIGGRAGPTEEGRLSAAPGTAPCYADPT